MSLNWDLDSAILTLELILYILNYQTILEMLIALGYRFVGLGIDVREHDVL